VKGFGICEPFNRSSTSFLLPVDTATSFRLYISKVGIWSKIKQVALTDVRVLARGMGKAELDAFERALFESDLGVAATTELVSAVTDEVRRGRLKTADDVRGVL